MAILFGGCATQMRVPGNRFILPETLAPESAGELELGMGNAIDSKINTDGDKTTNPLDISTMNALHYNMAFAIMPNVDFLWRHLAKSNSMIGGKVQFLGASRGKGTGQNLSAAFLMGSNQHELDGSPKISFEMAGKDLSIIHGWKMLEWFELYDSLFLSWYKFNSTIESGPLKNKDMDYAGKQMGLLIGGAFFYNEYTMKLELTYSRLTWSRTPTETLLSIGYSFSYAF